jgi:hypothetical protein
VGLAVEKIKPRQGRQITAEMFLSPLSGAWVICG